MMMPPTAALEIYQEHSRRPGDNEAKRETRGTIHHHHHHLPCSLTTRAHERPSPIQSNTLSHNVTLGFIEQTNEQTNE